jgi:hypothetical protein
MSLPNDVPGVPPEAMLLVDYDKNDVGEHRTLHHSRLLLQYAAVD